MDINSFEVILNDINIKKSANIFCNHDDELKSHLNIRHSYKKNNKRIEYIYIIPKIDLIRIIKENYNTYNFINNYYDLDIMLWQIHAIALIGCLYNFLSNLNILYFHDIIFYFHHLYEIIHI